LPDKASVSEQRVNSDQYPSWREVRWGRLTLAPPIVAERFDAHADSAFIDPPVIESAADQAGVLDPVGSKK
jgi:hypothetical protein